MARMTKVRRHLLLAIEEDRYETLPSPIYVKGFLSAYAKAVGIEPESVLNRYEQTIKEGFKKEPLVYMAQQKEKKFFKKVFKSRQSWIVLGVTAISLLLSFCLHPYLYGPSWETPYQRQQDPTTLSLPVTEETEVASRPEEQGSISIALKAVEKTWAQIHTDGRLEEEVLFQPGEGKSYQGTHEIEVWIGNAGGLEIVFDGKKLDRFGKSGEVVRLVFTREGVKRKES